MSVRQIVALGLAVVIAGGAAAPMFAAQEPTASIHGKAKQVSRPYDQYVIRAVNAETGQQIAETPLDDRAQYLFQNLPVPTKYLLVLYDKRRMRVLCTEGPVVTGPPSNLRREVDITCNCERPAAAWWLFGAAAAVGVVTTGIVTTGGSDPASPSR